MAQETQIREIRVVANVKGDADLKNIANRLGDMGKSLKSVAGAADLFSNSLQTLIGYFGVRELVRMSDEVSLLYSRITVLAGGTSQANDAFDGLNKVAQRTYSSLGDVAQVYARMASTTKELGLNTAQLLRLTELLTNSFRLSGAGAQEALSSSIQLSQGFASGQLRGQELRSVLEANVVLGEALAKSFKVTRGELYKLAEAGQITADKALKAFFEAEKQINEQAALLTPTIGQSLTGAFLKLQIAIFEVNKQYGINKEFADALAIVTKKLDLILAGIAVVSLPLLVKGLKSLYTQLILVNPVMTLIGLAVLIVVDNFDSLTEAGYTLLKVIALIPQVIGYVIEKMYELYPITTTVLTAFVPFLGVLKEVGKDATAAGNRLEKFADQMIEAAKVAALPAAENWASSISDFLKNDEFKTKSPLLSIEDQIKALNKQFLAGTVSADKYYDELGRLELKDLEKDFLKAKISIEKFEEGKEKLKKLDLARDFKTGAISIEQFDSAMRKLSIEDLQRKLERGKITAREFNKEILKFQDNKDYLPAIRSGAESYLDSIGNVAQQIAKTIESAFGKLEDTIFESLKTGKANFADFTQSILDDITKIIIRAQITAPLAQALSTFNPVGLFGENAGGAGDSLGGGGQGASLVNFAKVDGAASSDYYTAGISSGGGDISAKVAPVNVNVTNNAGVEVSQTSSVGADGTQQIDMLIQSKVAEALYNGRLDKALGQNYGVSRKGS